MAANNAVSMNVAENRAAVPMTVAEGSGTPGGLNRKADKVTGATAGNLAGLDSAGNLTDSGKAPEDFLEAPASAGTQGQVYTSDGQGGASWQDPTGGDPTEIIDDNAGSGDTDKVWSADKSHELLTEIVNRPEVKESDKTGVDFDLSDEEGNVILRLKDGHVETKNFDSSNIGKDSLRSGADLDISDENGNVILRLKDGGIETKYFDSKYFKNPIEAYSVSAAYDRSKTNTLTIQHPFKKGEEIYFHLDDGNRYDAYGRYATYYEGNTAVTGNRRGSNGYVRHVITADCESVGITIAASEYTDGIGLTLWVYKINGEIKPTIVTVKSDGTGMFQTIKAAVDSITDANHLTNPYVIEVYPGTYDTLEGFTDEEIASAEVTPYTQTSMVGVKLTDGISMKGIGRPDEIILTAYLDSSDWNSTIRGNISTLNTEGTMSLENLTIVGNNIRYCVHDDFRNPANSHDRRILRNLKFVGVKLSYYPLMTTYGAGMTSPVDYLIENCDFGFDLGIHTNGGFTYGCTIEVNNCSGNRFRIGDYASAEENAICRWIINNCNFQSIKVNRDNQTLSSHALITGVGNENSMIVDAISQMFRLGMIDLAPVGLTAGKAVGRQSSGMQFETVTALNKIHGVVIGSDDTYSYVQKCGYVSSAMLGLTGLAVGDYITIDNSGNVITGGTASNAIGKVAMIDENSNAQIKLML